MPRTSNKLSNSALERSPERAIRVERLSWLEATKAFFEDRRTRMIIGIVLLTFAVVAMIAYVSFLFTGTADQDILCMDHAGRLANRETVRNLLGLPGALLAQFLIDGSFGFVSVLLVMLIGAYAIGAKEAVVSYRFCWLPTMDLSSPGSCMPVLLVRPILAEYLYSNC